MTTLNLSDEETETLYDLLVVRLQESNSDGEYDNDLQSIKEKIEDQW